MFKRLMKPIVDLVTGEYLQDEHGRELPDPTPIAPPIGYKRNPTIAEQIRDMVRSEQLRQAAEQSGMETFEEADDFYVEDDFDPTNPYEANFDTPATDFTTPSDTPAPLPEETPLPSKAKKTKPAADEAADTSGGLPSPTDS